MKTGKTLTELATEIERQNNSKQDYIADSRNLIYGDGALKVGDYGLYYVTDHCHGQIADRLNIPRKYYDRMRSEAHELLENNINWWLRSAKDRRMVRTMDGNARALLSGRYRPLDNFDLANTVLPIIGEAQMEIKSCDLTEKRLYIKAVNPRVQAEVKEGDIVQAGIVISNSEIGAGAVRVEPLVYRLVCSNGMIGAHSLRRHHIGRGYDGEGDIEQFLRDETRQRSDEAFWMRVRDITAGAIEGLQFEETLNKLREAAGIILDDPIKAVEEVKKTHSLLENESSMVLKHLIEGGDLSQYGIVNAVTRTSQDIESYERATELEYIGGRLLEV